MVASKPLRIESKYLLNPYFSAINKYYITGDIRDLAKLVREEPIPDYFREFIAQILEGTIIPQKGSLSSAKSYRMRIEYERLCGSFKFQYYIFSTQAMLTGQGMTTDQINILNQLRSIIIPSIAKGYYNGNCESARRVLARNIKEHNWPDIPEI